MPNPWASRSHPGCVRQNNEDALACHPEQGLWLLADGMGGHQAGDVAASLACQIVSRELLAGAAPQQAFASAHSQILQQSSGQKNAMGSTLICLQQLDRQHYQLAWLGDSRAYRWRDGQLEQLSRDHSYVQSLLDSGQITPAQARAHPEKNVITQCLGAIAEEAIEVDTLTEQWCDGDLIILCSDGLNGELEDREIAQLLSAGDDLEQQLNNLEQAALSAGGRDNISMVAIAAPGPTPVRRGTLTKYLWLSAVGLIALALYLALVKPL